MTLWAAEPLLVNPTNFDIDERGRIWLIESVNYRSDLKRKPKNDPAGDRIVILEDTDGDGRAEYAQDFRSTAGHAGAAGDIGIRQQGAGCAIAPT